MHYKTLLVIFLMKFAAPASLWANTEDINPFEIRVAYHVTATIFLKNRYAEKGKEIATYENHPHKELTAKNILDLWLKALEDKKKLSITIVNKKLLDISITDGDILPVFETIHGKNIVRKSRLFGKRKYKIRFGGKKYIVQFPKEVHEYYKNHGETKTYGVNLDALRFYEDQIEKFRREDILRLEF